MIDNVHSQPSDMLNIDFHDEMRKPQHLNGIEVDGSEMLNVLSLFDPYGVWQLDLQTGKVTWTEDVYHIHGMPVGDGTVDLDAAVEAYHPEDKPYLEQAIEEAVSRKTGFRIVLRLKRPRGGYKLVKSTGMFRTRADGSGELFGTFSQFQPANRSVAAIA
ncbi:MAG: PAS domain-containing protein [Pseudomonadota bacterium]